jgi:hypothetical protein
MPSKGNSHQSMTLRVGIDQEYAALCAFLMPQADRESSSEIYRCGCLPHTPLLICYSYHKCHYLSPVVLQKLHKFAFNKYKLS